MLVSYFRTVWGSFVWFPKRRLNKSKYVRWKFCIRKNFTAWIRFHPDPQHCTLSRITWYRITNRKNTDKKIHPFHQVAKHNAIIFPTNRSYWWDKLFWFPSTQRSRRYKSAKLGITTAKGEADIKLTFANSTVHMTGRNATTSKLKGAPTQYVYVIP